jgi:poly(ribitol-phosphate) beta-N-acetylglucosaminyltransferase
LDASNITFASRHDDLLHCTTRLMDFVADLVEPGKQRDALHIRHFSWEVAKLLRPDFLLLDRAVQQRIHAGVRRLTAKYLTDTIRDELKVQKRVLLCLADRANLDDLMEYIRRDSERIGDPQIVADGERWYAAYPGFRDERLALPDDWFDVTSTAVEWIAKLDVLSVAWSVDEAGRPVLAVTAHSPLPHLASVLTEPIRITAGEVEAVTLEPVADTAGTTVRATFAVDWLLSAYASGRDVRAVRVSVAAFGATATVPMRAVRVRDARRLVCRRGRHFFAVAPVKTKKGRLVIGITPVTLRHVARRLRRKLFQGGSR